MISSWLTGGLQEKRKSMRTGSRSYSGPCGKNRRNNMTAIRKSWQISIPKMISANFSLRKSLRHRIFSSIQAENQCAISDVLCYEHPTKYLVSDTDYTDDWSWIPVLTANKTFILGYTTENFGIYDKGPCIILDDFTLDCKYVDFRFKVKSSAIKILRAKTEIDLRYIFEYIRFLDLNTTEHKRHYIAEIEPMSILLPSNEDADRIARLFASLDERLETSRKELKYLESQKTYMLQKMFI